MNPIITHDTKRIIHANEQACVLFGAELWQLVDQPLAGGAPEPDMQWLIELRMKTIREKGELGSQRILFMRIDGSYFWAECRTRRMDSGLYETEMTYISEHT